MSKHLDAMLAELDSMDSYETKAEAARVLAQLTEETALDLKSRMPRVPTGRVEIPKMSFMSPPPVHRAGIPVLATAAKPKRTAAEVAHEKDMKEAEKFAKAEIKAREKAAKDAEKLAAAEEKALAKAAKDADKAYAAYQKEQAKIALAFEKARANALKVSEKARADALKVSAPAKAAKAPAAAKAPTKAVLESEVLRLRTLLASRGIPY
jgi:hypothetical protein